MKANHRSRSAILPIAVVLALAAIVLSCSSGPGSAPVAPGTTGRQDSGLSAAADRVLWGVWKVSIDSDTLDAEIVPLRSVEFTANVTRFMQPPSSPVNMVSIAVDPSSDPASGKFVVDVTLKHPFPGLNMYNGFDVRGIFMSDGSLAGLHDATVLRAGPVEGHLLNPDGYTRWWNWSEFLNYGTVFGATQGKLAPPIQPTATVNGYKYFAQGLGLEDPVTALDPASRGFFPATPGVFSRRYEIQFKMDGGSPVLAFNYAVDASWEQPDASFAPDYPQEAFPISANCQEAYNVAVKDGGSTAYYTSEGDKGGNFVIDIEVFDWQGGANHNVPGEVNGIWLEGDIIGGLVDVLAGATVLPGTTPNSAIYEITIPPVNMTGPGDFEVFGTVRNTDPNSYQPQVPEGPMFIYADVPLAAYFVGKVTVLNNAPYPPPTVLGIDPPEGLPDCTEEHVTVTGTGFINGATFRLERSGETAIEATDVAFVNSTTLTGDLYLAGATPGPWDLTVKNPGGGYGTLPDAFTVLDVIFVDGDNAGDPGMDGTKQHPFDTIQKGIDAAATQGDKVVLVDQNAANYVPFVLKNNSHVIGCDWNDGVGWPTVMQTNISTYESGVSNATIEGLFFDITISSGDTGLYFGGGNGITLTSCKFSGVSTTGGSYFVRFSGTQNIDIGYCEFTKIYQRGADTGWRNLSALLCESINYLHLHHSEFHDCGYDVPDAGAYGNSVNLVRVAGSHNVDFHNLLMYNVFDKTNCIRPSPNPDPQNAMTVLSLSNINSFDYIGYFNLQDITVDDVRHADPPGSTIVNAGHSNISYMGMVGGDVRVWKNNIASNLTPTDESMVAGNSSYFGWWIDGYLVPPPSPMPMDYSLCYNLGYPLPGGANGYMWASGFINQCSAGIGSYQNSQQINPQYDMTPGANFYHPTNPLIAAGGDDGGEMGAFGGPEGDWIPPSQL